MWGDSKFPGFVSQGQTIKDKSKEISLAIYIAVLFLPIKNGT